MPERINALIGRPSRQGFFSGALLDNSVDEVLMAVVQEAARETEAPIALVSLVLDRIQFFRASQGRTPDLAAAQATDRDLSFCQLVVRDDASLVVEDAKDHPEVPQGLVNSHGVRAYLGFPLRVNGQVLGTLCVIDSTPRTFSKAQRKALDRLSLTASERLELLGKRARCSQYELQLEASEVVFAELRNLLMAIEGNLAEANFEHVQAAPLARLAQHTPDMETAESLQGAAAALAQIGNCLGDTTAAVKRLRPALLALQQVVRLADVTVRLPDALRAADALAHHLTRLHDGVLWEGPSIEASLALREGTLVAALATLLTRFADHLDRAPQAHGPIRVAARCLDASRVALTFRAEGLSAAGAIQIVERAAQLTSTQPGIYIRPTADAVEVVLTLANGAG